MSRLRTFVFSLSFVSMFCGPVAANQIIMWSGNVASVNVSGTAAISTQADGNGFDLVITLTNTADAMPFSAGSMLTGLYFDITSVVPQTALTMKSAVADDGLIDFPSKHTPLPHTAGTNICAPGKGGTAGSPTCPALLPGGWEAAYMAGGLGPYQDHYGIGTTGQSIFNGNADTGTGQADYSIAPVVGIANGSNSSLQNHQPFVYYSATFVLSGLTSNEVLLTNVQATYGTNPDVILHAANIPIIHTPEPSTITGVAAGILLLFAWRRRYLRTSRSDQ